MKMSVSRSSILLKHANMLLQYSVSRKSMRMALSFFENGSFVDFLKLFAIESSGAHACIRPVSIIG